MAKSRRKHAKQPKEESPKVEMAESPHDYELEGQASEAAREHVRSMKPSKKKAMKRLMGAHKKAMMKMMGS